MDYVDTSLVVSLITAEARTTGALAWLVARATSLTTSEWTRTEVASALSIKQRQGHLTDAGRAAAERSFERMADDGLDVVPLLTVDFRSAADYVRPAGRNLRGADALHLAVAARLGLTLQSLDEMQVQAARGLGIAAEVPVPRGSG
jgi:predicted nucleic acid-binding protein